MRWALVVLLLTGCREILGIDEAQSLPAADAEIPKDVSDTVIDSMSLVDGQPWSCGMPPATPGATVVLEESQGGLVRRITLSSVRVAGQGTLASVPRGVPFTLSSDVSISDCICTGCVDQVEVGFLTSSAKSGCVYDANPPCSPGGAASMQTMTITAPMMPGAYAFGFRLGQDFSCAEHPGWFDNGPPSPAQIIAQICVY